MSVYRFGVYVDELDDLVREIELKGEHLFQDFHLAIVAALKISVKEPASFFISNNRWQKINEITLGQSSVFETAFDGLETKIDAVIPMNGTRLIYFNEDIPDYTVLIQVEDIHDNVDAKKKYPVLVKSKGSLSGNAGGIFDEDMGYDEDEYSDFGLDEPNG